MDMINKLIVSHSLLNSLSLNPRWVKKRLTEPFSKEDSGPMARIGSVVDCLLTQADKWDERYQVIEVYRPFGLMGKFIESLPKDLTPYSDIALFRDAYESSGYKLKLERVIANFWSNSTAVKYYQYINAATLGDKTIITMDEYDTALRMKGSVMESVHARKYFDGTLPVEYQVRIKFKYMGLDCKAFLDGMVVDDYAKTITPFDLKTTSRPGPFQDIYLSGGYFRQAAFYTLALQHHILNTPWLEGYTIKPFQFVVATVNSNYILPATVFQCSPEDLLAGLEGGTTGNKYYKGVNHLIEDLKWHISTDYWDSSRDLWESNGVAELSAFK